MVLRSVAHLKRIAIGQVRRDIAVIGDRNIWAVLSETDVVSVVSEAMWKQTGSEILTARDDSKQHRVPPKEVRHWLFYKPRGCTSSGESVERCASFLGAIAERTFKVIGRIADERRAVADRPVSPIE